MPKQNTKSGPPSRYSLYTGGATKTPEMAMFYNIAHEKVFAIIDHWQNQVAVIDTERPPGGRFDDAYKKLLTAFDDMHYASSGAETDFAEAVYAKMRSYLWKGYETDKNKSGYTIDDKDKRIIRRLLVKLRDIRNYHSHIWHSNHMLEFDEELKDFITDKHDAILRKLKEADKKEVEYYIESYKEHPLFKNGNFITQEGRTFLLSFFLSSGEMSRFLGKRRGSKRNDELRYRVKHKVYRYYTHRDGATRNLYSMEEGMMRDMTPTEVNEINYTRQTYKIINYLNDVPDSTNAPALYPLHFEEIKNEEGNMVKRARLSTAEELIGFCNANNLLTDLQFGTEIKEGAETEDDDEEKEATIKEGVVLISYAAAGPYTFRLGTGAFHRLIIDCLRLRNHAEKTGEDWIKERLVFFGIERDKLLQIIETDFTEDTMQLADDKEKLLNEYLLFRHRGALKMGKKMSNWHFAYTTGKVSEPKFRENLIIACRELPIELRYHEFYFEADEKPRYEDRFTEFAVRYLMDYDVVPDWKWQVEKFEVVKEWDEKDKKYKYVNKKVKECHAKTPEGWRLSLHEGQVVAGIGSKTITRAHREPRIVPEYIFLIGHRALKNLLIAHLDGRDITSFLQTVSSDLQIIGGHLATGSGANTALLKAKQLPRYLKLGMNNEEARQSELKYKSKLSARIKYIKDELQEIKAHPNHINRNKKNQIIMRCYQFYDWTYPDGTLKFLRKDEYEQMGVYHYTLDRVGGNEGKNKKDLYFLLEPFAMRIPAPVKELLKRSQNIDELLENTITAAIEKLNQWKAQVNNNQQDKIKYVAQKLGMPAQASSPPAKDKREQWIESFGLLPFCIHPSLVQQALYTDEWRASGGEMSLSDRIRKNPLYTAGLRLQDGYYQNDTYTGLMSSSGSRAAMKNAIGKSNEQLTEDALLWKIARKYLSEVSQEVRHIISTGGALKVENLSKTPLDLSFGESQYGPVLVRLFFHQLDDLLMVQKKGVLINAAHYYLRELNDEQRETKYLASKEAYVITYEEIRQQMVRIYELSHDIIFHLLHWEKKIIDQQKVTDLPDDRINFKHICTMAGLTKEDAKDLNDLRKYAMHTEIPAGWNYAEKVAPGTPIRKLIGYTERIKYDYTIPLPDEDGGVKKEQIFS